MEEPTDLITEVQELVWELLDDQLSESRAKRLEQLLHEHESARKTYIGCVQMHVNLHELYSGRMPPPLPTDEGIAPPLPIVDLPQFGTTPDGPTPA